ncbi:fibroblast growth factor-binding protein 1 [Discoglossus pictus]
MKLRQVAFVSVLALLASQLILVECNKQKEGKKDKERDGNQKQRGGGRGGKKEAAVSPGEKGGKPKGGKGSLQGKFVTKDKSECTWAVTEAETVHLNVDCVKGESKVSCTFGGKPSSCSNYVENQKSYWKQITRALKKQKNLCQDPKAVLKSKDCRKGPQDAHLHIISSGQPAGEGISRNHEEVKPTSKVNVIEATKDTPKPTEDCQEDPDVVERRREALEYCGDSWSSFCNFFFSMIQSKSC